MKSRHVPALFLLIFFLLTAECSVYTANADNLPGALHALSAVLMDGTSGRVLYAKDGEKPLPNASTTKVLTCILALENGNGDDYVPVSSNAASQPPCLLPFGRPRYVHSAPRVRRRLLPSPPDVLQSHLRLPPGPALPQLGGRDGLSAPRPHLLLHPHTTPDHSGVTARRGDPIDPVADALVRGRNLAAPRQSPRDLLPSASTLLFSPTAVPARCHQQQRRRVAAFRRATAPAPARRLSGLHCLFGVLLGG